MLNFILFVLSPIISGVFMASVDRYHDVGLPFIEGFSGAFLFGLIVRGIISDLSNIFGKVKKGSHRRI